IIVLSLPSLVVRFLQHSSIVNSTNNKASHASSSLMKYVMHLLLIMDMSFELDNSPGVNHLR
ncbi:MAG: hypothetical protein L0G25_02565, partial [Psychrobacter sp.]|nr:hypothetical protein [Psychrobacter sp.]